MAHEPPATVTRQWCPECGRTFIGVIPSLEGHLPPPADPGEWSPGLCGGTVQTLTYELRAEPQRTREEMIEAGIAALRSPDRQTGDVFAAEAVLIAAGVIEAAPDA